MLKEFFIGNVKLGWYAPKIELLWELFICSVNSEWCKILYRLLDEFFVQ